MPLILPARTLDSSYEITNSLRFSDSNYLTRTNTTQSGAGTNFTFSAWLKMTTFDDGGYQGIFAIIMDSNDYFEIYKDNSEKLQICQNINGSNVCYQNQDFMYRDYSAWYHLVVSFDNSASGEINKIKTYVNGQEISADEKVTNSNPFGDVGLGNSNYNTRVGAYRDNNTATWNGYMSDVYLIAGQTLGASEFGKTDSNGVWVPKEYTGSFGDNGFFLEFKQSGTGTNSSGMGADTSGEDNHFAVTGLSAVDVTQDTPTNNFCTLNPVFRTVLTLSEGNTKIGNGTDNRTILATQHSKAGYYEMKYGGVALSNGAGFRCGIVSWDDHSDLEADGMTLNYNSTGDRFYLNNTSSAQYRKYHPDSTINLGTSKWNAPATTDIIGVAWRYASPNGIWFSVNGVWYNGSGTASTTLDTSNPDFSINDKQYIPYFISSLTGGNDCVMNFGNPPYANSSSNSDANGYGDFEYPVPSGFYALCTKNLAEYG